MIERLRIRNLAIVDDVELELGDGLNVVTGETGAGKSLVVQSVGLLIGDRADSALVRDGHATSTVEGEFRLTVEAARRAAALLEDWGVEFDGETLIVRREVSASGKSRALVNQSAVTQGSLKRLGELLADLHGQHEHQSLLRPGAGSAVLDRLGGCGFEREAYAGLRDRWREAMDELATLERRLADIGARRAWLETAARAIDDVSPVPGEEEELRREAARLAHVDRLRSLVASALAAVSEADDAAVDRLAAAAHAVEQAAALDPTLSGVMPSLDEARIAAGEAARGLADYSARLEVEPSRLEEIETRRAAIARLTRMYGRDVEGLIAWRAELASELGLADDADVTLAGARDAATAAEQALRSAGRALSARRRSAARQWGVRLTRELRPLGLPHGRLEFAVTPNEDEFPVDGLDHVEMRFTANPDEPPDRLQRIASGGELSRVMLALKCALEAQDGVDVLIFDEVDSGVGGVVAQAVGERLRKLAQHRQVLCITHLPMIAALAPHHVHVSKHVASGRTAVRVERLDGRYRVEELARMLAGERVTDTTRRQARELLAAAEVTAA